MLGTVEFAEIDGLTLDDLAGGGTPGFDEAPIGVILAVLVAEVPTKEKAHGRAGYGKSERWEEGGSALQSESGSKPADSLKIPCEDTQNSREIGAELQKSA